MPRSSHTPERTCIACGRKLPKRELLRIVRTPEGQIAPDLTGKTAGRGAYLCSSPECWQKGIYRGGLERGLKASLSAQEQKLLLDFYQEQAKMNVAVEG
ncbi:MAG: YlxR family protein [Chloroflexi bacterium]|nr:YlxR family protein [Chloroflexota bacterium]MDA1218460.1 YlxR family protein [Chloroflexota bacterium]PKB56841.1 MAG: hypothetical protein BZY73_06245 [SAR202 cluster bacterium Casp-Chloro-G3]